MQLLKVEFQEIKISSRCKRLNWLRKRYPILGSLSFSPRDRKTVKTSQFKSRNTSPRFEVSVEYSLNLKENDSGQKFRIPKKVTTSWFPKSIF